MDYLIVSSADYCKHSRGMCLHIGSNLISLIAAKTSKRAWKQHWWATSMTSTLGLGIVLQWLEGRTGTRFEPQYNHKLCGKLSATRLCKAVTLYDLLFCSWIVRMKKTAESTSHNIHTLKLLYMVVKNNYSLPGIISFSAINFQLVCQ